MDVEETTAVVPNFNFPSKPEKAENLKLETISINTNHFPLTFDTSRARVHQYHLKILPEIPEDSRDHRKKIVEGCSGAMKEALGGDFYARGAGVFAANKV